MLHPVCLFSVFGSLTLALAVDLEPLKIEKNLERRSELALVRADEAVTAAKKAYEASDSAAFKTQIADVEELAEFSLQSLQDTGKAARRSPKYFKRAELKLRALLRRLDTFERDVSADDREPIEQVKKRIHALHDQILLDIMSKK